MKFDMTFDRRSFLESAAKAIVLSPLAAIAATNDHTDFISASTYAAKYTGRYAHKVFKKTGHNPPQESPKQFADAIIEADGM